MSNPALPTYPADFPLPDRSPYSYQVDMGVIRSPMSAGNARQRRLYRHMPTMLALSFHMRIEQLYLWQNWVNAFAYDYFNCPASTMYAGGPPVPGNIRAEVLRFAGDLAITMDGWDWVAVTVAAEMGRDAFSADVPTGLGGWIIGGTPAAPNSAAWVIAGTPGTPSAPDVVIAGSPALPSSLV